MPHRSDFMNRLFENAANDQRHVRVVVFMMGSRTVAIEADTRSDQFEQSWFQQCFLGTSR